MIYDNDTIFALSSGQGRAGIAVIRISGNNLNFLPKPLKPRMATVLDFYGIDKLVAVYFNAPKSFTGEDIVELYCHGGVAVVQAIFDKLKSFGFRMAEPGEFSKRAFYNNKMNLAEIDSMRELIDSKTESQRKRAMRSFADSSVYESWRNQMIELAALSAARMDYSDDDLPKNVTENILKKTQTLMSDIKCALSSNGNIIENGFRIVLAGHTNVGKSSLFNRLVGESRAIVSDIHGTTRDVVSSDLNIDGFYVRLFDTAGIRESNDKIEIIGIEKTKSEIEKADLVLHVIDDDNFDDEKYESGIVVVNKADGIKKRRPGVLYVSAKTGEGIDCLLDLIKQKIHEVLDKTENDLVINNRVRGHLESAVSSLDKVAHTPIDLQAEHISDAANEIGMILGFIGSDEIYDSVFGQLCLGK